MKACLVIFLILLAGCDKVSQATPSTSTARFQAIPVGEDHAWKLDTQTGDMWLCV